MGEGGYEFVQGTLRRSESAWFPPFPGRGDKSLYDLLSGTPIAKAIRLPSGDQLIVGESSPGTRVERNFLSGPPRAGTT